MSVPRWAPRETDAETNMSEQDVSLGGHVGSMPVEGRGRKQGGAEEDAEWQCATHLVCSQVHRQVWSCRGPAEMSQVGTTVLGLYPTLLVSGSGLALDGRETRGQAVLFR